ncbi:hypothetical protein [Pseudoalteromonas sp. ASV78]|uniref:hypothetical protein n=1 Tax=Pseudoalteromonas sp. ASV78 TaxID=3397851 RepID=UPI0039FD6208
MIRFRLVLTVLLMFAALFSVQATAASSMAVIQTQPSVLVGAEVFSQFSDFQPKAANTAVSSHLSVSKQVAMLAADQQPQGSGFESLQPRLTVSNSSLFLYPSQVEPNYAAIFEFFVPSLARQLYLQPLEPPTRLPWFVSYDGKKSRLSGWKDANLQYRAVLTYHS